MAQVMDRAQLGPAHVDPTERFSFVSHAVGAAAAVVGLVLLVVRATGALAITSLSIYAASLVVLFSFSAIHHLFHPTSLRGRRILRRMDHIAIFCLIAGTYTPVCLVAIGGAWGWSIFGVIWGLAVAGTLLKIYWLAAPRWFSTLLYVLMGWTILVALPAAAEALPTGALWLLFLGGVVYSLGAVMYARKRPDPWPHWLGFHGAWHAAVLAGAALHFALIWNYIL